MITGSTKQLGESSAVIVIWIIITTSIIDPLQDSRFPGTVEGVANLSVEDVCKMILTIKSALLDHSNQVIVKGVIPELSISMNTDRVQGAMSSSRSISITIRIEVTWLDHDIR